MKRIRDHHDFDLDVRDIRQRDAVLGPNTIVVTAQHVVDGRIIRPDGYVPLPIGACIDDTVTWKPREPRPPRARQRTQAAIERALDRRRPLPPPRVSEIPYDDYDDVDGGPPAPVTPFPYDDVDGGPFVVPPPPRDDPSRIIVPVTGYREPAASRVPRPWWRRAWDRLRRLAHEFGEGVNEALWKMATLGRDEMSIRVNLKKKMVELLVERYRHRSRVRSIARKLTDAEYREADAAALEIVRNDHREPEENG